MPLPPAETLVLKALRSHADFLTWHEGKNGVWAKVIPDDVRAALSVRTIEDGAFSNILIGTNVPSAPTEYEEIADAFAAPGPVSDTSAAPLGANVTANAPGPAPNPVVPA